MRFVHTSDIHLGFQKDEELQKIEQEVFEKMVGEFISRKVDFVLMPGDIFHVNIPEMRVQKFAFAGFRRLHEAGIPVYVVYGSHDFSPVSNSVIDLLEETGYITKVTRAGPAGDGKIRLDFVADGRTGAKIAGLPGLKGGRDEEYYDKLDRDALESEGGFKILLFHGGITEAKTDERFNEGFMPASKFPRGFDYYAGGHLHKFVRTGDADHPVIVYPGTPFAGFHSDLEDSARGVPRGFVLAEFGDGGPVITLVEVRCTLYGLIEVNADKKSAESVNGDLFRMAGDAEPGGKVMIIKVAGELSSGRAAEVDVHGARDLLVRGGARAVNVSRNRLTSREYRITAAPGRTREEIETNTFSENIGEVRMEIGELTGDRGVELAKRLLRGLSQPQLDNETAEGYDRRVMGDALKILGLDDDS